MKILRWWIGLLPVPVIQVNRVPGSKEGFAAFVAVVIQSGSHDYESMILHEKVHVVFQVALMALCAWLAPVVLQLPWWLGALFGAALYACAWYGWPAFRRWQESMADAVQHYRG